MHSVTVDRARNLIEVKLSGFFSPEMTRSAGEDVRDAIRSLGEAAGQHLTLYDITDVSIAPSVTMEVLRKIFAIMKLIVNQWFNGIDSGYLFCVFHCFD